MCLSAGAKLLRLNENFTKFSNTVYGAIEKEPPRSNIVKRYRKLYVCVYVISLGKTQNELYAWPTCDIICAEGARGLKAKEHHLPISTNFMTFDNAFPCGVYATASYMFLKYFTCYICEYIKLVYLPSPHTKKPHCRNNILMRFTHIFHIYMPYRTHTPETNSVKNKCSISIAENLSQIFI